MSTVFSHFHSGSLSSFQKWITFELNARSKTVSTVRVVEELNLKRHQPVFASTSFARLTLFEVPHMQAPPILGANFFKVEPGQERVWSRPL